MHVGLSFSIRVDATQPLGVVQKQVEAALGCTLEFGDFVDVPALVGRVLGMQIGLLRWGGLGGAPTYQLHGRPAWNGRHPPQWEEIEIGRAVVDLLERSGAPGWRIPSIDELRAETQYRDEEE